VHLFLVRHGQSFVNLEDWDGGFVDAGLTELGQHQAELLGRWLAAQAHISALYTSTMARAAETAAYIAEATGIPATPDDRLREFGNCYADGSPVPPEKMPIEYPEEWWGTERPNTRISPEGESWMLFRTRVSAFLAEIAARHAPEGAETVVVVVCHAGVIEAAFDHVFNVGEHRRSDVWTHNTGVTHFQYMPDSGREVWRLHAHSMVHHLVGDGGAWFGSAPLLRDASRVPAIGPRGKRDGSAQNKHSVY